jgi:hypothetical protein
MGAERIGIGTTPTNYTPAQNHVRAHLEAIDTALASAGGTDFADNVFRISDDATPSKKIAFQASAISASTVRTITMPDADVNLGLVATAIQRDGSVAFTADQSLGGFKLTSVADPTAAQDAATKAYVDAVALGLAPKKGVRAATTGNITLSGTQTIDGESVIAGDRVLVKDQSTTSQNGIYVVAAGAWTRATDFDSLSPIDEINGAWVPVQNGTVNKGRVYVQYGAVATLGTDPILFDFYNPIASLIGGDMITVSGSTITIDLASVSGLESTNPGNAGGQLRIKLEASNPTLEINGSNELKAKLDAAGAIASGASGLAVQVDDATIERNANALRVKALGIGSTHLATDSVITAKIQNGAVNADKLNSNVADQSTITGGAGTALAVQRAPAVRKNMLAGESMAANTTFLVRMARSGESAGRVYKADRDATSADNFYVVGVVMSTVAVNAGDSVTVTLLGSHDLGSSDSAFLAADIGKPVFLTASGAFSVTAPSTANHAVTRVGMVETTTRILVQPNVVGVN